MQKREISIRADLYEKLEKAFPDAGFSSVDEYVEFVMEEMLKKDTEDEDYTPEDEEKIKKRLEDLGYVD